MKIAVVIACHNRRKKTLTCLQRLQDQDLYQDARLEVFLLDDNSTDGTSDAVMQQFPYVKLIHGSGDLYWCGGMRVAWTEAAKVDPDYYLLLNDDTYLHQQALRELLKICCTPETGDVAVGAICDPVTQAWSYGGLGPMSQRSPIRPTECRTMNANCVLISRAVYRKTGVFYHVYTHAMGDMDYGFAARRDGFRLMETPHFVGTCETNPTAGTWRDISLPRSIRLSKLISPKGLPPTEWFHYNRRNSGALWFLYFLSPYLRVLRNI